MNISPKNSQNSSAAVDAIAAITVFGILVMGSLLLKTNGMVGEASLVSLLTASGIFGFIVYFRDRIKKAGLTGFELHEIRRAESSIKGMAKAILELAEADEHGYKQPGWDRKRYEKAKEDIRKLIH